MKRWDSEGPMQPDDEGGFYAVEEVDANIAELEHQLDIRKAAIDAQFRLMERVKVLEKALTDAYSIWSHAQEDSSVADRMADVINAALQNSTL